MIIRNLRMATLVAATFATAHLIGPAGADRHRPRRH